MNLHRDILRLAVPSILANITVPLVGMVDIAVAGHLGASGNLGAAALIGGISIGTMLFDICTGISGSCAAAQAVSPPKRTEGTAPAWLKPRPTLRLP
jgi:Na+-driven multidrug efflux pump